VSREVTAIEAGLITQLEEARAERDAVKAVLGELITAVQADWLGGNERRAWLWLAEHALEPPRDVDADDWATRDALLGVAEADTVLAGDGDEVRVERDRYEEALFKIVRFYEGRSEQRAGGAVAIAREALEASES
jgi:hypothetical protein